MILMLRGHSGVGKTTVAKKVMELFNARGFVTEEIREAGKRLGFDIVLWNGRRLSLARAGGKGPKIGKYTVFLENIELAVGELKDLHADFMVADELGKMEALSKSFRKWVLEVPRRCAKVLVTAPSKDIPIVKEFLNLWPNTRVLWVNVENRSKLLDDICEMIGK